MIEIGKLHWLSVIWNCCQSFGWLYLAVLNVVKLFCSLLLLWHEWQCIASVKNKMLVWFSLLLNSLLSASHMEKDWEVAVEVTVFHLPTLLYIIMCVSQKDRILFIFISTCELNWGEVNLNKGTTWIIISLKRFE